MVAVFERGLGVNVYNYLAIVIAGVVFCCCERPGRTRALHCKQGIFSQGLNSLNKKGVSSAHLEIFEGRGPIHEKEHTKTF